MNRDLVENIFKRVIIFSIFIILFMLIFVSNYKSYVLGYIFGTSISMTNFLLLKNSVERSVMMDPGDANRYATSQYFLRMAINAVVLVVGAKADYLNLLTMVLGLVMVKIVIVISSILGKDFLSNS